MNCRAEIVKFLLLLLNLLSMTCCIGLLVIAFPVVKDMKDFAEIKKYMTVNTVLIATIVMGFVVLLLSLLGCCGALRAKPYQLRTYSVIMLLLFVGQVILVIYVWTHHEEIRDKLSTILKEVWNSHKTHMPSDKILHKLEKHLKCCGLHGYTDYIREFEPIPPSCLGSSLNDESYHDKTAFHQGCLEAVTGLWDSYTKFIKYGALAASGVIFLASTFASYLAHKMRREMEYMGYD
ncbi:hypothetical protein KR044_001676 [Drosophila immigrans]|nr:hypothetical protein KR044_001676 [Drosophila immigrans]